jgi:hypothetical protein
MNRRVKQILKIALPPWLLAITRSCGGIHFGKSLFAGNLLSENLSEAAYSRIASHLIFPNGVRKSTYAGRNAPVISGVLQKRELNFDHPLKVLDIGASFGMDSVGNLKAISQYFQVESYTLADLYTEIFYDKEKGLIFDQDKQVIQVEWKSYFAGLYFEFKYPIERIYHLLNIAITSCIRHKFRKVQPDSDHVISISLFHPEILKNQVFRTARLNVFDPVPAEYDLIICLNLLQTRYFSNEMIKKGIENLCSVLTPGGLLLAGVTDQVEIYIPDIL